MRRAQVLLSTGLRPLGITAVQRPVTLIGVQAPCRATASRRERPRGRIGVVSVRRRPPVGDGRKGRRTRSENAARCVRFRTRVRNPCSRTPDGICRDSISTESRVGSKPLTISQSCGPWRSAVCQKAATSRSNSIIRQCPTSLSMMAVSETMPPPANGSMSSFGVASICSSQ